MPQTIILGAGPAGLAAGYELSKNNHPVLILEKENKVGGMGRTEKFKSGSFDLGPHRFFTKNQEIQKLWQKLLQDELLTCSRLTRIYYRGKYFLYPIKLFDVLKKLGFIESFLDSPPLVLVFINSFITSSIDWNLFSGSFTNIFATICFNSSAVVSKAIPLPVTSSPSDFLTCKKGKDSTDWLEASTQLSSLSK